MFSHVLSLADYMFHPCLLLKILWLQPSSCVSAWWTPGGSSGLVVRWLSLNVFLFLSAMLALMKSAELLRIVQFADWTLINSINLHPCRLCYPCTWLYPTWFHQKALAETWTCIYRMRKSVSLYFYTMLASFNKTVKGGGFCLLWKEKQRENTKYVSH